MRPTDKKNLREAIEQLEGWLEKVEEVKEMEEEYLGNAESAEYPNEERIDRLTESIDMFEQGISTVQSGIDELRELL